MIGLCEHLAAARRGRPTGRAVLTGPRCRNGTSGHRAGGLDRGRRVRLIGWPESWVTRSAPAWRAFADVVVHDLLVGVAVLTPHRARIAHGHPQAPVLDDRGRVGRFAGGQRRLQLGQAMVVAVARWAAAAAIGGGAGWSSTIAARSAIHGPKVGWMHRWLGDNHASPAMCASRWMATRPWRRLVRVPDVDEWADTGDRAGNDALDVASRPGRAVARATRARSDRGAATGAACCR